MKNGQPVGNLKLGRRFSQAELEKIRAGVSIKELVACAPRAKTQAEIYNDLFGEECAA